MFTTTTTPDLMPGWLRFIAQINLPTCRVDALRRLMIPGAESVRGGAVDFAALIAVFVVLLSLAVRPYPSLAE